MINVDIRQASIPEALADFEDESFDLVHADPPYFRVLAEAWDRQWESREVYLGWLKAVLDGFQRVLKPNGSYFGRSQWALPTAANYAKLQELFNRGSEGDGHLRREYEGLRREYEGLRREYEGLRREYEGLRRPFFAPPDGFTDVWTFAPAELVPGRHPAEKPLDMMRHILEASTRPGALVLDAFAGSGSMSAPCVDLGREAVAIEEDATLCEDIRRRVERHRAVKTGEMHRAEMRPIDGPLFKVKK